MRTSELELLLHVVDSDDEEISPKNEDSFTTNEIKLGIENTKYTENTDTKLPKIKNINDDHGFKESKEKDDGNFSLDCELCQKTFSRKVKLKEHKEKEKNPCDMCSEIFCTKKELDSHKISKHKKRKFECDFCKKYFDTQFNLNRHYKSRNQQMCEYCDLVLCNQVDMTRHMSNSHHA